MKTSPSFRRVSQIAIALSAILVGIQTRAADTWGPWPNGQDPKTVGVTLVQNLLTRPKLDLAKSVGYQETCAGYGAVRFAADSGNGDLLKQVIARYQAIVTPEGAKLNPKPVHVDSSVFGILPLEIYKNTQDPKYLSLGLSYADAQFAKLNPEGLSSETRYYIDDAYKISVMQILAFRATAKPVYAAQAVKEITAFIDKLQQPSGLFFHGPDAHVAWGRGNGWIAAGLAETLVNLPVTDPAYAKIMASYKAMMAALLKVQAPDGRWRQVVDDPKAFEENSCTGYFIFALAEGVDQGWLDAATYTAPVEKAWGALCGQVDAKGNVADVSVLTEHSTDEAYYLARPIAAGNLHGQFAALWAAAALLDTKP
jgi:unsaturated rhamnogalacturonyl hydrolase